MSIFFDPIQYGLQSWYWERNVGFNIAKKLRQKVDSIQLDPRSEGEGEGEKEEILIGVDSYKGRNYRYE